MTSSPSSETRPYVDIWRTDWEDHGEVMPLGEIWIGNTQGTEIILLKILQSGSKMSSGNLSCHGSRKSWDRCPAPSFWSGDRRGKWL